MTPIARQSKNNLAQQEAGEIIGVTKSGETIWEYTLENKNGVRVSIMDYGAIITRIFTPDRTGHFDNIVLSYSDLSQYERCPFFIGAVIGRYAGRIGRGQYQSENGLIPLDRNQGENTLHGGFNGFHKQCWRCLDVKVSGLSYVEFELVSPDGEGGFPGVVTARVRYSLSDDDQLFVDYYAITDAPTVINLTQHTYFNLYGHIDSEVSDHHLTIYAKKRLELEAEGIPTGRFLPVKGTEFDFTSSRVLGDAVKRLDHDFVLENNNGALRPAGVLFDPHSGRRMDILTDQPSLHIYTGQNLKRRMNKGFREYSGICFETQAFPDSPNHAHFPSTRLAPGEAYKHRSVFKFSADT